LVSFAARGRNNEAGQLAGIVAPWVAVTEGYIAALEEDGLLWGHHVMIGLDIFNHIGVKPLDRLVDDQMLVGVSTGRPEFYAFVKDGTIEPRDVFSVIRYIMRSSASNALLIGTKIGYHSWERAEDFEGEDLFITLASMATILRPEFAGLRSQDDLQKIPQKTGTRSALAKYVRKLRYTSKLKCLREAALNIEELLPQDICDRLCELLEPESTSRLDPWPYVQNWASIFQNSFTAEQRQLLTDALLRGGLTAEEFRHAYQKYTSSDVLF
jgi:hypothetical protein